MDEVAIELGIYFVALVFCMLMMLDKVRGKYGKLDNYLLTRRMSFFRNEPEKIRKVVGYLWFASLFYVALPFMVLLAWTCLMFYSQAQEGGTMLSPICIFILGMAMICFCVGLLKIKWNNFRVKAVSITLISLALLFITLYQGLVVFGWEHTEAFFPTSAFFLNFNAIILSAVLYMEQQSSSGEVSTLLEAAFPSTLVEIDPDRDANMLEEIEEQAKDPNWKPTWEDLTDIVTV
jgi:hypothetical protein